MKSSQPVSVEIVLDVACVWSYLGYSRFARALQRFRDSGATAEVAFRPFQVDPRASYEGEPLVAVLTRNFGSVAALEQSSSSAFAGSDGVEIDIERGVHANTLRAHALIAAAVAQGRGEQIVPRLFRAYHVAGLNVGDLAVLAAIADETGVDFADTDTRAVQVEADRIRRSGVQGVPLFVFRGGESLSGARSEEDYFQALFRTSVAAERS